MHGAGRTAVYAVILLDSTSPAQCHLDRVMQALKATQLTRYNTAFANRSRGLLGSRNAYIGLTSKRIVLRPARIHSALTTWRHPPPKPVSCLQDSAEYPAAPLALWMPAVQLHLQLQAMPQTCPTGSGSRHQSCSPALPVHTPSHRACYLQILNEAASGALRVTAQEDENHACKQPCTNSAIWWQRGTPVGSSQVLMPLELKLAMLSE